MVGRKVLGDFGYVSCYDKPEQDEDKKSDHDSDYDCRNTRHAKLSKTRGDGSQCERQQHCDC
ncbi:hypothetical protein GCM10007919_01590 [Rhizobium indigoferae]|nr:hypothetical protein GCM10007919_01590 [Rhizobium indigoferae]